MSDDQSIQSQGGDARAKKLSPEERKGIARAAAAARWENVDGGKTLKATHGAPERPLRVGSLEIPCYVLENGQRVITQAGALSALSISQGTATKGGGDRLTNFISTKSLNPHVTIALRDMITEPIKFRAQGSAAYGYDAAILPEICDVVLAAREAGSLNYQQEHIAKQCELLLRAFARVGIAALIDEVTGYQEIRDKEALQEILKEYISGQLLEWTKTFPIEFYKEIFRLKGWAWNRGKMPGVVGKYTNDLIYERLAPGVLSELQKLNPQDDKGHRKHKHHQYLTKDVGHPSLSRRLYELIGMARASDDWDKFYRLVDRTFPRVNTTIPLQIDA
jgi:hypothetical protein